MSTSKKEFERIINSKAPILIIGKFESKNLNKNFSIKDEDYFLLESDVIKIKDIRELIHFSIYPPLNSQFKLAAIFCAEKMTIEAGNALLKLLEEPPEYLKIVLQSQNIKKILPTIVSRCQKIRLQISPDTLECENYLSPEEITKMTYAQRFKYVAKIIEADDVADILTLWQAYFRNKLLLGEDVLKTLNEIARAKDLLETNVSLKLLLENLSLTF